MLFDICVVLNVDCNLHVTILQGMVFNGITFSIHNSGNIPKTK